MNIPPLEPGEPLSPELVLVLPPELRARCSPPSRSPSGRRRDRAFPQSPRRVAPGPAARRPDLDSRVAQLALIFAAITILTLVDVGRRAGLSLTQTSSFGPVEIPHCELQKGVWKPVCPRGASSRAQSRSRLSRVLTSGCGGGTDAQAAAHTDPAAVEYSNSVLSFSHPAAWKAYPFRWDGELHFRPLVYLSTQPVHDPCAMQGNTDSCGFPVGRLQPGGVLVTWNASNPPAVGLGQGGSRIRVEGHPARRVDTAGGMCRSIGADRTIDVLVQTRPLPSTAHGVHRVPARAGAGASREERRCVARVHQVPLELAAGHEGPGRTGLWSGLELGSAVEKPNQTGAGMHGIH